jgi:bacterioferritin-associated ferredoxin
MYVCLCHCVTDQDIRRAADEGCADLHELTMRSGCGATCGSCRPIAADILSERLAEQELRLPVPVRCAA